jgi:type IV pilus assembly protein PilC
MKFSYKARSASGRLFTGKVEAENRYKAAALLRERRLFVVELKESASGAAVSFDLNRYFQQKVTTRELAVMCRQLATMVKSGVPILQSLNILYQQCDNKTLKETLQKVTGLLEGGKSLTEALKAHPKVFPQIFISMIEAGEVSGALDQVLERLAVNFEKEHDLKEKVKSAMTYPAVVVVVAVLAVIALMVLVVPTFVNMLQDMNAPIPFTTQSIILTSGFLKNYWYLCLLMMVGVIAGYKQAVKTGQGKKVRDSLVLKLPIFGPVLQKIIISRFCRSLSTLLKSGVPVLQSLEVVKNIAGNYAVIKSIEDAENSIKKGQSISLPLQKSGVFPPMVTRMISIGEETGSIDALLEKIADFYEREVEDVVSRLSSMLEPVLIVGMGGVVGFIILSIMLPMFSVINSVE